MGVFTQTSVIKTTGVAPGTKATLAVDRNIWRGKIPVDDMSSIASGGAAQSYESYLSLLVKAKNGGAFNYPAGTKCRIWKCHGSFPSWLSLNAGVTAAYGAPVNTPSAIATLPIKSKPDDVLELSWDVTDEEFQYLVTQFAATASSVPFKQSKQAGWSAFPVIYFDFIHEEKDYEPLPEGGSDENYSFSKTDIYVVDENGECQLFGSLANALDVNEIINKISAMKGLPEAKTAEAISEIGLEITGNTYGQGMWLVEKAIQGFAEAGDGYFKKVNQNNNFRKLEYMEFYIHERFTSGRQHFIHIPNGTLTMNGNYTIGDPGGFKQVPFMISALENYAHFWTENLIDTQELTIDFEVT